MTASLESVKRDPHARALAVCLDLLVRMDPRAVATHHLQECTDEQFDAAVAAAAGSLWGTDEAAWPAAVKTALRREP